MEDWLKCLRKKGCPHDPRPCNLKRQNRRDFSGCRLCCVYPNKSDSQTSSRKRLPAGVNAYALAQPGLEVTPCIWAAMGLLSEVGWTNGPHRSSGLLLTNCA
ncbi:Hypothetical predicted protein [Marmota monax]|nr:hypothetical protein GHT09_003258 [Marmota monax]VTJ70552.1 Hypothetical predicted protein [Marmota monax]